eukprot:TRINITY_DN19867_c0_g1_i1.p1 TRINITY_DN19867_c0_g1~~TRINITY_DN19867_c0_g1_i1.p1  ORF type:complete len:2577 (+),score=592.45 TRINITY_DN19867_c0_g1_i1:36-7733(+)
MGLRDFVGGSKEAGFREKKGRENWARDDSVKVCKCGTRFSTIKRRHHCRSCGGVFCDACTNFQALVPTGQGGTQGGTKRVCQPCYNVLKQTQSAATTATGSASVDLQFVQIAIGKIRQEADVQQQRLHDRIDVLAAGTSKILDDIRLTEQRVNDGSSLFTGNTHDILNDDLKDLSAAYERRQQRAKELTTTLMHHTLTAFFTVVQSKLLDILLHFVLAASLNETTAACNVNVLGTEFRVSCRNLSTHFLRQCGEGASVRDLCEVMQDVAEDASLRITFRFEEQIASLTSAAAKTFGECVLARIVAFFRKDVVANIKSRMPPADLIVDAVSEFPNCASDDAIPLATRDEELDHSWNDKELLSMVGIKTTDGSHWNKSEAAHPYKYYYALGTNYEAKQKGYHPTGKNRNCIYPIFNLERAAKDHQLLIEQRGTILNTYFLSHIGTDEVEALHKALSETEEASLLLDAIDKIRDLLREPSAYGKSLLVSAMKARKDLDDITRREKVLVRHSQDLVDAPEALTKQASYIKLQHEIQDKALDKFVELMSNDHVQRFYSHLRLKFLQQLITHRAYATEALSEFPEVLVAGSVVGFNEQVLNAVDSVVASDRTGIKPSLLLLDEASHIMPRWLAERYSSQLQKLTHEGIHTFADCSLARSLFSLPPPSEEGLPSRAMAAMGTGTITAAKEKRSSRSAPPISASVCLQLSSASLDLTVVGHKHVVLPTTDSDANWKEHSLVTKCGLATPTGKYNGTRKHHKPQKYGYVNASMHEANSLETPGSPKQRQMSSPARGRDSKKLDIVRPEKSVSEWFPPGCEAEAYGLIGAKELNGIKGRVEGIETMPPNEGRVQVIFPPPYGEKALKHTNVWRLYKTSDFNIGYDVETKGGTSSTQLGRVTGVDSYGVTVQFMGATSDTVVDPSQLCILRSESKASPERAGDLGGSFLSSSPSVPASSNKVANLSWAKSTLVCTPRIVTAGASINCVLVIKDHSGKKISCGVTSGELDVLPFGHSGVTLLSEPTNASDDGSTFQFTLELANVGTFPIGVACRGKCKISNNVTVVAGPIDWLGRSKLAIAPELTTAGEPMFGRIELRDRLGNLATSAGLEDFTIAVHNVVELATTVLKQADDGSFIFSFVPTEEGEIDIEVGFCGLMKQSASYHECRPGRTDFKNTLVVLDSCEAEVGDVTSGVMVLRDIYGNRAANVRHEDVEMWLRAGDDESRVDLVPVKGEVSEYEMQFKCVRRGLTLLESESIRTRERVVTKVTVSMPKAAIDWSQSTVSLVPREVQAGHTVTCTILARDSFGNLLSELDADQIELCVTSEPTAQLEVKHGPLISRGGTITCGFEPLTAGTVWATASMDDARRKSNDVLVTAGSLSWEASTVTIKETAQVGESVAVNITARDRYGNVSPMAHNTDFQVTVWNEGTRLDHSPINGEMGKFFFSFEPRATGHAWVEVFYSGSSKESNRCVISPGRVCWDDCSVVLDRLKVKAGEVLRCDVTLTDKCGNETATENVFASDFLKQVCDVGGETLSQATKDSTPLDGVGSRFWFQFSPTAVGDVMARVAFRGANKDSNLATIAPDEVCWERSVLTFDREDSMAGVQVSGKVLTRDRFENPSEILRYTSGLSCIALKQTDITISCKNFADADHELLDVTMLPTEEYGTFAFNVLPKMMGEVRAFATLVGGTVELSSKCLIRGGGIDWSNCSITLNPAEIQAGEEASCSIAVKDKFGNDANGAKPHDFIATVWNENNNTRISDVVATGEATFAFTAEPTRAGTACSTVKFFDVPKESNVIYVKPAEMSFPNSTLSWATTRVFAGDHLEGTLTFRDRFGNPTSALPPNEVEFNLANGGGKLQAFIIDDYVSATETTQVRFYCEPIKKGVVTVGAVRKKTGETIEGSSAEVKSGPVDWTQSTTELPARNAGEKRRVAQAGESVIGVITCRDKYGNQACPGTESSFNMVVKANGQLVVSPQPYVPSGVGAMVKADIEHASVFHFELKPEVAGTTEIEVRYSPQPLEAPHKIAIDVKSGSLDWRNNCAVLLEEREVTAGDTLHFTIVIKDSHGNATGGTVGSMFVVKIDNGSSSSTCSPVTAAKDSNNMFVFTAVATVAGDACGAVVYQGASLRSPACRVMPGPLFFPKCTLGLPDKTAAGEQCKAVLSLRDKFNNPTSLGSMSVQDFVWTLLNVGTPSEGSPRPQSNELQPSGPLAPGGMFGGQASDLTLPFEPRWKGSMTVTCKCARDETAHKLEKTIPVSGGKPDTRTSVIKINPELVRAGNKVSVEVFVRDCHKNPTAFDIKSMSASIVNERDSPVPSELLEIHGGFKFTFVPVKQGKAKVTIKEKGSKNTVAGAPVTVYSAEFHPASSHIKLEPSSQVAGRTCTAMVTLRDQYKNSLSNDAEELEGLLKQIKLEVKNGYSKVAPSPCKVKGLMLISELEPTERGPAFIELTMPAVTKEKLTSNHIEVKPAALSFPHCSIVLDADTCPINVPISLILTTKDRFNNITTGARAENFNVKIVNEDVALPDPRLLGKDKSSTAFTAQISPVAVGSIYCEVTFYPPDGDEPVTKKSNVIQVTS